MPTTPRPAAHRRPLRRRRAEASPARPRHGAALPVGELRVPEGFGLETEVRIVAPREAVPARLTLQPQAARPQANLCIRRFAAPAPNAAEALERLVAPLGAVAPRFARVRAGLVRFADGREGPSLTVRFEALVGHAVYQTHAVRLDGPIATHFVLTAPDADSLEGALLGVVESFRP